MMESKQIYLSRSQYNEDIWYQESNNWIEDKYDKNTEACFGINACGKCEVIAYSANGKVLSKKSVLIIPSQFSLEQYEQMQIEVKSLFEVLAFDLLNNEKNNQKQYLREIQIPLYDLDQLKKTLDEFRGWLEQIFESPAEQLDKVPKKIHHSKVKKWTPKTIINQSLYPFNERILTENYERNHDVIEHRMIRGMIEEMIDRIRQEQKSELYTIQKITRDVHIRKQNLKNAKRLSLPGGRHLVDQSVKREIEQMINELSVLLGGNKKEVKEKDSINEHLEVRIVRLNEELKILEERQQVWQNTLALLNQVLENELLTVPPLVPENTHLFSMEPKYKAVFECYESYLSIRKKLNNKSEIFIESILNSPHLYEVWILLQIIKQLACWNFDTAHAVQEMLAKYNSRNFGSLKGVNIKFLNKCNGSQVRLMYNAEVSSISGGILTPDYILMFRKSEMDVWAVHTLDAKYKPYTDFEQVDKNTLEKDLNHSACRYLDQIKKRDSYQLKSAALVHTDVEAEHWNLCDPLNREVYRLSHFHVLPGDVQSLHVYLKRIFHYFGNAEELCPCCGNKVEPIQIQHRTTYICPDDHEVWVRNRCKCTWKMEKRPPLYKYAAANYNVQVRNEWNVYCPICHEDVNENKLRQDLFGRIID